MSWLGLLFVLAAATTKQIIMLDGTRMDVRNYEVGESIVQVTMPNGVSHVIARTYVDVEATFRANRDTNAREALERYGVKDAAHSLAHYAQSALDTLEDQVSEHDFQRMMNALHEGFDGDELYKVVVENFAESVEESLLDSWLHWLSFPLPERMLDLASRSQGGEAEAALFVERTKNEPFSTNRAALVDRLDEATQTTATALDVQVVMFEVLERGYRHLLPNAPPSPAPEQIRAAIQAEVKETTRMSLLFAYDTTSDEDLLEYIAFWETDNGRRLTEAAKAAFLAGIRSAGDRMENALARAEPGNERP